MTATPTPSQVRVRSATPIALSALKCIHLDWEIWTAGIVTDTATRDLFISSVRKWASDGRSSQPFGDWYETTNGNPEGFRARPVVGGHLGEHRTGYIRP